MRLHSLVEKPATRAVVVCGQAICDYTLSKKLILRCLVVVCGQAICDYTLYESNVQNG